MLCDARLLARHFLATQPWFNALDAASQAQLTQRVEVLQAGKGQTVLGAGEPVQGWYAVLSGLVKLQTEAADGRRSAFIGVPDGEWFGEGSVLKEERRRYAVVALRDSWLMCLPRDVFTELQQGNLRFNQYLVQHFNMRLGQAMTLIEASRIRAPEHRVALYLSRLFWRSTRRLYLTQEELGTLVGLSRQTVNRVLRQLAERGIVSSDLGRVVILDDAALGRYLEETAST
ncbi:MAG: Crp/Fnr family transcriptional regulator [Curvibacter sp. GWA2_64_110]|nr:MAG: Crp/Fnr family transcriptional regulator [Curvibacter sp. GWA2_64_110]HCY15524.1 Crp/Fnr family transcriptional regulator [Curvibacter sp.]